MVRFCVTVLFTCRESKEHVIFDDSVRVAAGKYPQVWNRAAKGPRYPSAFTMPAACCGMQDHLYQITTSLSSLGRRMSIYSPLES